MDQRDWLARIAPAYGFLHSHQLTIQLGAFDGSFLQSFGGFDEAFVCRQNIIFDVKTLIVVVIVL
jgi:hypothetical protein